MRYRLISEIRVFIYKDEIFIAAPDNKHSMSDAKKFLTATFGNGIEYSIEELQIPSDNIKVSITMGKIQISSPNLPDDRWYLLLNYSKEHFYFYELIENNNISLGKFNELFEICIKNSTNEVLLVNSKMPTYNEAYDESIRHLSCAMSKTTKKRIIGHRYDTQNETIYWLGSVKSYMSDIKDSEFVSNIEDSSTVFLYTKDIGNAKKVSDIFKNGILCYDNISDYDFNNKRGDNKYIIYMTTKSKMMVDSGERLKDDTIDFNTTAEYLLDSTLDYYNKYIDNNVIRPYNICKVLTLVFHIFNLRDLDPKNLMSKDLLDRFKDFIGRSIIDELPAWNNNSKIDSRWYLSTIKILNQKKFSYYIDFFKYINIDLDNIIENILSTFSIENNIFNNFDNYIKYDIGEDFIASLRSRNSSAYELKEVSIESLIPYEGFQKTIIDICNAARIDRGRNIVKYDILNCGTKIKPLVYEVFTVDISNIISWYKNRGLEVPKNLKNEILSLRFRSITISIDKDRELC